MKRLFTRREMLKSSAAVAALPVMFEAARAFAQSSPFQPEDGASISILRFRRFVPAEREGFDAMVAAFSAATGVDVTVDSLSLSDSRAKARVAAAVGTGPDMVMLQHGDAHTYPSALMDLTDVADFVGEQGGGWLPLAEEYGKLGDRWITLPAFVNGNGAIHYRKSWSAEAGFDSFPTDTDGLLDYARKMKAGGHPIGITLGNAPGDGNSFAHWLVWAFGGRLTDENDNVTLDSPETVEALKYVNALAENFIEGVGSWDDGGNNRAYLGGEISATPNAVSILRAAEDNDPAMAEDTELAPWPVGPVGELLELNPVHPLLVFQHTAYPEACKAFLAWMMQPDNYNELIFRASGFFSPLLEAGFGNEVFKQPKRGLFESSGRTTLSYASRGRVNPQSAQVFADLVVVQMVAQAATGRKTPEEAAADAAARARRFYDL